MAKKGTRRRLQQNRRNAQQRRTRRERRTTTQRIREEHILQKPVRGKGGTTKAGQFTNRPAGLRFG